MPVLEPNPTDGHRKLLLMFGAIAGIMVAISILAVIARSMG